MFLRKRDFGILIVCFFAIITSFYEQESFNLELIWVQPSFSDFSSAELLPSYRNGHYPVSQEKLPRPLVTDVDGDSRNEIVFVTEDFTIGIVDTIFPTNTTIFGSGLPNSSSKLKAQASLLPSVRVHAGRRPVALASGYLIAYQKGQSRQQVIVVVTNGWTVMCFSSNLKLIWETNVRESVPEGVYHREVAAIISTQSIRVGDKGVVIVGGRLASERNEKIQ